MYAAKTQEKSHLDDIILDFNNINNLIFHASTYEYDFLYINFILSIMNYKRRSERRISYRPLMPWTAQR